MEPQPIRAGPDAFITLDAVSKAYRSAAGPCPAITDLTLYLREGEFAAVTGRSGSGKSTLLNLLAGIDRPTTGAVRVGATDVHALSERDLTVWRGRAVGIVFQFFQLIPTLTAAENVMLPMDFNRRWPASERPERADRLLDRLGVADQARKLPAQMSGGQQQRVAAARALANAPALLLADEPTGNLDSHTAGEMLDLFAELSGEGQTIVMVTHDDEAVRYASRVVGLVDGRIVADSHA